MLNLTVQAPINNECLQPLKNKKDRHRKGYFASYYQNNRQHLLDYSKECYQVKKLLASYLEKEKKRPKGISKKISKKSPKKRI